MQFLELIATLIQDANREIRKDGKKLESLLLNENKQLGLKELIYLFEPFACATFLMREDPELEGYLASILDPKFKNLEFASEKFEATKQSLKQKMIMLQNETECLNDQPIANPTSNLASFFNSIANAKKFSPIDIELKTYFDLP
ncbi:17953_t:CDS:2 [Gigaspora rosea]|nr:17953_t:CDS:2 [Gigaspora rosea]